MVLTIAINFNSHDKALSKAELRNKRKYNWKKKNKIFQVISNQVKYLFMKENFSYPLASIQLSKLI
jgi:hypothetical protein